MSRSTSFLFLAAMVATASAQSVHDQAETLFLQGQELMTQRKFAAACAVFERSHQLESNLSTLLNHANCREKNGQLATAWRLFAEAERQTHDRVDDISQQLNPVAAKRAGQLQVRLSKLSIGVAPEHRLDGLEILRDADGIDPDAWNQPLPIDGGTYKITARAPGRTEWSSTVVVKPEGDMQTIAVPKLEPELKEPPRPAPKPEPPPTPVSRPTPLSENVADALSLGGTFVSLGLLIGAFFTYAYSVDVSDLDMHTRKFTPATWALASTGGLGFVLAPSFGHWYAGKYLPHGAWIRLAGSVPTMVGMLLFAKSEDGSDALKAGFLIFAAGSALVIAGTFDDINRASDQVRRYNRRRHLAIGPIASSSFAGLSFGGRF